MPTEPLQHCECPNEERTDALILRGFFWGSLLIAIALYGTCDCGPRAAPVHIYGDES